MPNPPTHPVTRLVHAGQIADMTAKAYVDMTAKASPVGSRGPGSTRSPKSIMEEPTSVVNDYLCLQCTVDADFQKNLTPDGAVALLKAGALRSAGGKTKRSRSRAKLLAGAEGGQWPYAAVLSCIDSRAPVETIFDAETGDLFVARVAGNVASPDLVASLEYATKYAGTKAVLVLGHTKCGAVKGAWAGLQDGHLTGLLARIQPAVDATKAARGGEASAANIDACVAANVKETVAQLRRVSATLAGLEAEGKIAIVGAVYDVATGEVGFFPEAVA